MTIPSAFRKRRGKEETAESNGGITRKIEQEITEETERLKPKTETLKTES
jgi:hypothetical protein